MFAWRPNFLVLGVRSRNQSGFIRRDSLDDRHMASFSERPFLILGVERSGSTWVANIVDAHPRTQLYMEPFSPRIDVFPDFPDRLVYVSRGSRYLDEHVRARVEHLPQYKYPFPHRSHGSRIEREIVYRGLYPLSEFGNRILDRLGWGPSIRHLRFKNLNKNRVENPFLNRLPKTPPAEVVVLKELRLNFKAGLIADLWPDARVMVAVRNPLSQIASILRLLDEGALHELRSALYAFLEAARSCVRFDAYRGALNQADDDDLLHRAVAYWFVNYDVLLQDLEQKDVPHRLVRHEDISREPYEEAAALLRFAGLEPQSATDQYLTWSTQASNEAASVMDTRRDSQTYYLDVLRRIDDELTSRFLDAASPFWPLVSDRLQRYKPWLEEHL